MYCRLVSTFMLILKKQNGRICTYATYTVDYGYLKHRGETSKPIVNVNMV